MEPSPRRQYDEDFKRSAIELIQNGQSVSSVSQSLGVGESLLYKWKADQVGTDPQSPSHQQVYEANVSLRKQVKQLEIERDILKKALCIFSRMT